MHIISLNNSKTEEYFLIHFYSLREGKGPYPLLVTQQSLAVGICNALPLKATYFPAFPMSPEESLICSEFNILTLSPGNPGWPGGPGGPTGPLSPGGP